MDDVDVVDPSDIFEDIEVVVDVIIKEDMKMVRVVEVGIEVIIDDLKVMIIRNNFSKIIKEVLRGMKELF